MFENIKRLRQISKNQKIKDAIDYEVDKEERAIVDVGVDKLSSALSPFCAPRYMLINEEFASFLEMTAGTVPLQKDLTLHAYTKNLQSKSEKNKFDISIDNYYTEKIVDNKMEMKRNALYSLWTFLAGCAILAIILFLRFYLDIDQIVEIFTVFSWVLLWESLDTFFLKRGKLRTNQIKYYRLQQAKIVYNVVKK